MGGNSFFYFKRFSICQEHCAMKVGTDSILLGAWCDVNDKRLILDIGTGTGLVALMAAQRSQGRVVAVEIDHKSALQAAENVDKSPWKDRVEIYENDIANFDKSCCMFDAILCNPPYFRNSLRAASAEKNMARHNDTLSYEKLAETVSGLLDGNGEFYTIIPYNNACLFLEKFALKGLYPTQSTSVVSRQGKPPIRELICLTRRTGCVSRSTITVLDSCGEATEEFKNLVKDFYLKY